MPLLLSELPRIFWNVCTSSVVVRASIKVALGSSEAVPASKDSTSCCACCARCDRCASGVSCAPCPCPCPCPCPSPCPCPDCPTWCAAVAPSPSPPSPCPGSIPSRTPASTIEVRAKVNVSTKATTAADLGGGGGAEAKVPLLCSISPPPAPSLLAVVSFLPADSASRANRIRSLKGVCRSIPAITFVLHTESTSTTASKSCS
mmetsp:Transcript_24453/g.48107  ORF Transcript_24453/g.48107 Transcript_24453/m.48107 type:complete len:203 (+) Transcript_24453:589-1197(+)